MTGSHDLALFAAPIPMATEKASTPRPTASINIVNKLIQTHNLMFLFSNKHKFFPPAPCQSPGCFASFRGKTFPPRLQNQNASAGFFFVSCRYRELHPGWNENPSFVSAGGGNSRQNGGLHPGPVAKATGPPVVK